jgi:toxin YoeB
VKVVFSPPAWEDYQHWRSTDRTVLRRINRLIEEIRRSPYEGIGKPEPLKYGLAGAWSRRITDEHRLVYRVTADSVEIIQARYRY